MAVTNPPTTPIPHPIDAGRFFFSIASEWKEGGILDRPHISLYITQSVIIMIKRTRLSLSVFVLASTVVGLHYGASEVPVY